MKIEKFIVSLFMLNILLIIILIFSLKNDVILAVFEDIFYSKKVDSSFMSFPPEMLKQYGFVSDSDEVFKRGMDDIFKKTAIKHSSLDHIDSVPVFDKAVLIIKMFSTMGNGICLTDKTLPDRIVATKNKEGCQKDYAMIFSALAKYSGIKSRIVKNSSIYGVEIYDGTKWVFLDPYFAVTAYDDNGKHLSFYELNAKRVTAHNIRLDFFGGDKHCLFGKDTAELPYYKGAEGFGNVHVLMGDNVFSIAAKEASVPLKPKFVSIFAPYRSIKPHWVSASAGFDNSYNLKKVVSGGIVIWVLLFLSSDILLPIYFIRSKIIGRRS